MANDNEKVDNFEESIDEIVEEFIEEEIEKADNRDKPGDEPATRGGSNVTKGCDKLKKKKGKKEEDMEELEEKSHSVDEGEYEAFKSWKEDQKLEKAQKEKEATLDDLKKAVSEEFGEKFSMTADILKSLNEKIEELGEKVDSFGSKASSVRKSVKDASTIEKSFEGADNDEKVDAPLNRLEKARVLNDLTELCKAGKINVEDVTMFESGGIISPMVQSVLQEIEFNKKGS